MALSYFRQCTIYIFFFLLASLRGESFSQCANWWWVPIVGVLLVRHHFCFTHSYMIVIRPHSPTQCHVPVPACIFHFGVRLCVCVAIFISSSSGNVSRVSHQQQHTANDNDKLMNNFSPFFSSLSLSIVFLCCLLRSHNYLSIRIAELQSVLAWLPLLPLMESTQLGSQNAHCKKRTPHQKFHNETQIKCRQWNMVRKNKAVKRRSCEDGIHTHTHTSIATQWPWRLLLETHSIRIVIFYSFFKDNRPKNTTMAVIEALAAAIMATAQLESDGRDDKMKRVVG